LNGQCWPNKSYLHKVNKRTDGILFLGYMMRIFVEKPFEIDCARVRSPWLPLKTPTLTYFPDASVRMYVALLLDIKHTQHLS
jgi:hypothetical protein